MGLHDRPYYDDQRTNYFPSGGDRGGGNGGFRSMGGGGGFGKPMRMWSFTIWLIVINVAVFLLDILLSGGLRSVKPLELYGHFSLETAVYQGQIWRFLTFQFLHGGFWHLAFNMLGLYWFGPMVESYLGSRRFMAFYLLTGVAGALLYILLAVGGSAYGDLPFLLSYNPKSTLVGASAGIYGVLMAAAFIRPNEVITLLLMFVIPVRMKIRTLVYGLVVVATYVIFTNGDNAGGQAGHLGGALLGFFLIRKASLLNWAIALPSLGGKKRGGGSGSGYDPKPPSRSEKRQKKKSDAQDLAVDRILAKVGTQGLQSLTASEKKTLADATKSQQKRRAG